MELGVPVRRGEARSRVERVREERETKTAVSRQMVPDWDLVFPRDPIEACPRAEASEGSSLERR
jgi:hypothetical protein